MNEANRLKHAVEIWQEIKTEEERRKGINNEVEVQRKKVE